MARMRSASTATFGVSCRAVKPVGSPPKSLRTIAASACIGCATTAFVPALDVMRSLIPISTAYAAARRSAVGDLQMFPVQTNKTRRICSFFVRRGGAWVIFNDLAEVVVEILAARSWVPTVDASTRMRHQQYGHAWRDAINLDLSCSVAPNDLRVKGLSGGLGNWGALVLAHGPSPRSSCTTTDGRRRPRRND